MLFKGFNILISAYHFYNFYWNTLNVNIYAYRQNENNSTVGVVANVSRVRRLDLSSDSKLTLIRFKFALPICYNFFVAILASSTPNVKGFMARVIVMRYQFVQDTPRFGKWFGPLTYYLCNQSTYTVL